MEFKYVFLLIEDSDIDKLVIKQLLKKVLDVTNVNTVNNGKEGIEWIINHRKNFNQSLVILLDIQMPIMNGFEFLLAYDKLSDDLKYETQIFVLSSSLVREEIKRIKSNQYVTEFLSKPIAIKEFGDILYPTLKRKMG
ncbi:MULTISPECIES: response regulator [unclassified Flavobacterium]|jgi:CheY-like chemotaxis protein|uniref:response regulator n=1 Tax=unclassified Flavobacterium TaxID=196869 RepID=UPI00057E0D77|nr:MULTISPECIES: response regulator [unclassified Flavobacterium]KIA97402.1 histidine kinase [Flavobacterium sp. KMS]KIC01218.1 histidine kinase [Flavobacterium sp. JRM]MEA9414818.1 response regulator [Flavobacterium sp. PL02]OUL60698.1 response regulator [Flavobacterium sp. AJR]